jgi:hypothetical protein
VGRGSWDRLATEGPGLQRRLWKAPGWEGAGGIKVFNSRGRGGARSTPARRLSPGLQPRWALSSQFSCAGRPNGVCGRTPVPSLRDPVIFPRTHAGAFLFRPFGAGSCGARPGGSHEKVVLPHTPCAPPFTLLVPRGGRNQESKRWGRGSGNRPRTEDRGRGSDPETPRSGGPREGSLCSTRRRAVRGTSPPKWSLDGVPLVGIDAESGEPAALDGLFPIWNRKKMAAMVRATHRIGTHHRRKSIEKDHEVA